MEAIHDNLTEKAGGRLHTRIGETFARARQEQRSVLIPYFMCGFPDIEQSVEIILAAAAGGADIIELGIPFSDPLADGPTIQEAGQVALNQGVTMHTCMEIAQRIHQKSVVPLVLMGYYNPILAYGIQSFCQDAKRHGISGLIVPDLPAEEADDLQNAATANGLALIFLAPPTTPDARIAAIVKRIEQGPEGFLYCVSLSGVTGSRKELPIHLQEFIQRVRRLTEHAQMPLAIGFGLSTPEHIAGVTSYVDGAVVGSAYINLINRHAGENLVEVVTDYTKRLKGIKTI